MKPHLVVLLRNRYRTGTRWTGEDGVRNIFTDLLPRFASELLALIGEEQNNLAGDWSALAQALRALVHRETRSDAENNRSRADSTQAFYNELKERFAA